jgi:hypothetical protein
MLCKNERGQERAQCLREYRVNGMNNQDPEELVQKLMANLDDHFFRTHSKGWWKAHCTDFFTGMTTAQCETMMQQPATMQTSSMSGWMQDFMDSLQKKMPNVKSWSSMGVSPSGSNTSVNKYEWSSVSPDGSMQQYYHYEGTSNGGNSTVNITNSTNTTVKSGHTSSY